MSGSMPPGSGLRAVQTGKMLTEKYSKFQKIVGPDRSKIIDLPGGQINGPWSEKYSNPFLPTTPSSSSLDPQNGLFELTRRPLRALDSPRVSLPDL